MQNQRSSFGKGNRFMNKQFLQMAAVTQKNVTARFPSRRTALNKLFTESPVYFRPQISEGYSFISD